MIQLKGYPKVAKRRGTNVENQIPSVTELESELQRERYKIRYSRAFRSTIFSLITVAAVAVLVAVFFLPVFRTYGDSMAPQLSDGNIVVSVKTSEFETGDIIAFYYNNKILVKRVVAKGGDWVEIDDNGDVYVNQIYLEEPYINEKALGECNIEFPYQVPEGRYFVMGDHRKISVDSRNTVVGCISNEEIVGKLIFRVWPLADIGPLK